MHTLKTERLILRPLQECDEALFALIYADPQVMRHVGEPLGAEASAPSFRTLLAQSRGPKWRRRFHVLTLRDGGTEIGLVGLVRSQDSIDSAEIGAMILTGWQARGFACEGLSALIGLAFDRLGLDCLHADHAQENTRPIRFMKQLGFKSAPGPPARLFWTLHRGDRRVHRA